MVAQYIRENDISDGDLSDRALINALLMSTAQPMFSGEGIYYPVIQQGSSLIFPPVGQGVGLLDRTHRCAGGNRL